MKTPESKSSNGSEGLESGCGGNADNRCEDVAEVNEVTPNGEGDTATDTAGRTPMKGTGRTVGKSARAGKSKLATGTISKGTQYRPKISHSRRQALEHLAVGCGVRISVILNEAIDRRIGAKRRGMDARAVALRKGEILLHASVLDLIRYEQHLDELVTRISNILPNGTLREAESLDSIESELRGLLETNAALRSDLFGALKALREDRENGRHHGN